LALSGKFFEVESERTAETSWMFQDRIIHINPF
jgi:hypothetical protein